MVRYPLAHLYFRLLGIILIAAPSYLAQRMSGERTHESVLQHIKDHPEQHRHDYPALVACCMVVDGTIDLLLMEAHGRYVSLGLNGGVRCDVNSGPCACGAWH